MITHSAALRLTARLRQSFAPVHLVGVVGEDFRQSTSSCFKAETLTCRIANGARRRTFRWKGDYNEDLNQAVTHETASGFRAFPTRVARPLSRRRLRFSGQHQTRIATEYSGTSATAQTRAVRHNELWINIARDAVWKIFERVDVAVLNDGEAKLLTECDNVVRAGACCSARATHRHHKKGEHGALMFSEEVSSRAVLTRWRKLSTHWRRRQLCRRMMDIWRIPMTSR
jgi:ribokinase